MNKRVLYLILILVIISLPIYGISMTQDIIFNDALEASIKLNSHFEELYPGESAEFEARVTGLSCSDVTYSLDNSEYVTLTRSGKKAIVTMNKDAKNFGELTIKLTARAVSAPITDVATIFISETPGGRIYPSLKSVDEFELFRDLYEKIIIKAPAKEPIDQSLKSVDEFKLYRDLYEEIIIKEPDKEPIKHINEGCYSTY